MQSIARGPCEVHCFSVGFVAQSSADAESPRMPPTPDPPPAELDEPGDLEDLDSPCVDDSDWDVFIADDDERDPLPEPGDFWVESDFAPSEAA